MALKTLSSPLLTRIYHIGSASKTGPILIFIPGNPGLIEYYTRYLKLLSQSTGYEVLGISHAGFAGEDSRKYTLEEQVEHKVRVIRGFASKEREVYILGHSVGSWIMQRVVDATPQLNYKFIGFVTPTIIDIHKSTKGSLLYPVVECAPWFVKLVAVLPKVVRYLPDKVVDRLLSIAINTDFTGAKSITKEFIKSSDMVSQSLTLASEEMLTIQSDWEYHNKFLRRNANVHKWFFFAQGDHWVSDQTAYDIEKSLELVERVHIDRDDEIRHSFCISQSEKFAEITLNAFRVVKS